MTYTSQSGRERSIGRPMIRATCSVSCPPRRAAPAHVAEVEVEVEVWVRDPVRMVELERHLDQAST